MLFKKALLGAIALSAMLTGTMARAEDLKEFRIGILGGENETDRLRNFGCLADHLKETFGFEKVSLFPAADYDGVIQGLLGGTLDFAELGASGYAAVYIKDPKAVTPILTTQQTDGSTGYYSIGLARKDSGIKTIADAKGKTLGYADPGFNFRLSRSVDPDPQDHWHAERQVLCKDPVQWRSREQSSCCL